MNIGDRVIAVYTQRKGTVIALDHINDLAEVIFDESPSVSSVLPMYNLQVLGPDGLPVVRSFKDLLNTVSQPTPPPEDKCQHKWVHYEPLRGEKYWCCANAGCGIRFVDTLPVEEHRPMTEEELGWLYGQPASVLPKGNKTIANKDITTGEPIKITKPGWTPVSLTDYMDATRYMIWSKK